MKTPPDESTLMRRRAVIMACIFSLIGGGLALTGWELFIPGLALMGGLGGFVILLRSVAMSWRRFATDLCIALLIPLLITGACAVGLRAERYFFANLRVEPIARMLDERLRRDGKLPEKISTLQEIRDTARPTASCSPSRPWEDSLRIVMMGAMSSSKPTNTITV